jgi:flavin-dependent dehydrogenase
VTEPVAHVRRDGSRWIVNDRISAPMLVGAGGHFCPVSQLLNRPRRTGVPVVVAQEVELPLDDAACPVTGDRPEIYFCEDLAGYGWCVRKGRYVNVGLGRFDRRGVHRAVDRFVRFLETSHRLAADWSSWKWRGHAYETAGGSRRTTGDGVLLAGDAAGLASSISGEGIGPAVTSGLLAAAIIVNARGRYDRDRLEPYAKALRERDTTSARGLLTRVLPRGVWTPVATLALQRSWFVRRIVLDRWFLHAS